MNGLKKSVNIKVTKEPVTRKNERTETKKNQESLKRPLNKSILK